MNMPRLVGRESQGSAELGSPEPFSPDLSDFELPEVGLEEPIDDLALNNEHENLLEAGVGDPFQDIACMYLNTSLAPHSPDSTLGSPRLGQQHEASGKGHINAPPWTPYSNFGGASHPGSGYYPTECINPSLLQGVEFPNHSYIGIEPTGPPNVEKRHALKSVAELALAGPPTPSNASKAKRTRTKISSDSKSILESHFQRSQYPSDGELAFVAGLAKLEIPATDNWFKNRRKTKRNKQNDKLAAYSSVSGPLTEARSSQDGSNPHSVTYSNLSRESGSSGSSIERWLQQPIEEESASIAAIQQYVDTSSFLGVPSRSRGSSIDSSYERQILHTSNPPSVPSRGPPSSVDSSRSASSAGKKAPRQGVRQFLKESPHSKSSVRSSIRSSISLSVGASPVSEAQVYRFQCTVNQCNHEFKNAFEWKRHEESTHYKPCEWVCCKDMETFPKDECIFCQERMVDFNHMRGHKFTRCSSKPNNDRSRVFSRKDYLLSHIRQVHHPHKATENPNLTRTIDGWTEPNGNLDPWALHCGFCGQDLPSWDDRAHHVADHFRKGLDMSAWWPLRKDNEYRHPPKVPRGRHPDTTSVNGSFPICQCCSSMEEHVTEDDPQWTQPCRCCCCDKKFNSWASAKEHQLCSYYSCSFLPSANLAFYGYQDGIISCCFCGEDMDTVDRERTWESPEARQQHLARHSYRSCAQQKYTRWDDFVIHLYEAHGLTQNPDSIGIMQLRSACSRSFTSTFEPYAGTFLGSGPPRNAVASNGSPLPRKHRRGKSRAIAEALSGLWK